MRAMAKLDMQAIMARVRGDSSLSQSRYSLRTPTCLPKILMMGWCFVVFDFASKE